MLHNSIFSVKGMYYNALGGKGKEFGWMERKKNECLYSGNPIGIDWLSRFKVTKQNKKLYLCEKIEKLNWEILNLK